MMFNYNIISLIDFLALVQGVLLGFILIFERSKTKPSQYLGLFLITFSIELVDSILGDLGLYEAYPRLIFIPTNFYFLSVPLFYLYVKSLLIPVSNKRQSLILLPGINEFLIFTVLFFLPISKKYELINSHSLQNLYSFYQQFALLFSIAFAILALRLVAKYHQKAAAASKIKKQQLKWVRYVSLFIILFHILTFINIQIPNLLSDQAVGLVFSLINVFFIFWVGISGLRQPKIQIQYTKATPTISKQQLPEQNAEFELLQHLLESKELYRDVNLNLPSLANKVGISRRELSQLINKASGTNYNGYINQYRVNAAKKLLLDPDYQHFNMAGIAFEVGFNSKASFFSVFKKITGMSPGMYKNRLQEAPTRKKKVLNRLFLSTIV